MRNRTYMRNRRRLGNTARIEPMATPESDPVRYVEVVEEDEVPETSAVVSKPQVEEVTVVHHYNQDIGDLWTRLLQSGHCGPLMRQDMSRMRIFKVSTTSGLCSLPEQHVSGIDLIVSGNTPAVNVMGPPGVANVCEVMCLYEIKQPPTPANSLKAAPVLETLIQAVSETGLDLFAVENTTEGWDLLRQYILTGAWTPVLGQHGDYFVTLVKSISLRNDPVYYIAARTSVTRASATFMKFMDANQASLEAAGGSQIYDLLQLAQLQNNKAIARRLATAYQVTFVSTEADGSDSPLPHFTFYSNRLVEGSPMRFLNGCMVTSTDFAIIGSRKAYRPTRDVLGITVVRPHTDPSHAWGPVDTSTHYTASQELKTAAVATSAGWVDLLSPADGNSMIGISLFLNRSNAVDQENDIPWAHRHTDVEPKINPYTFDWMRLPVDAAHIPYLLERHGVMNTSPSTVLEFQQVEKGRMTSLNEPSMSLTVRTLVTSGPHIGIYTLQDVNAVLEDMIKYNSDETNPPIDMCGLFAKTKRGDRRIYTVLKSTMNAIHPPRVDE